MKYKKLRNTRLKKFLFLFFSRRITAVHLLILVWLLYAITVKILKYQDKQSLLRAPTTPLNSRDWKEREKLGTFEKFNEDSIDYLNSDYNPFRSSENKYRIEIVSSKPSETAHRNRINRQLCSAKFSCQISYNNTMSADVEVFNFERHVSLKTLTSFQRNSSTSDQFYVWWFNSNPQQLQRIPHNIDRMFNLSLHYRTDADVHYPFGNIHKVLSYLRYEVVDSWKFESREKQKIAVAILPADCNTISLGLLKNLVQAGLQVDIFGTCVGRTFHEDFDYYKRLREYYFYIVADESFFCKDHISKQFWESLRAKTVPLVFGPSKESYLEVAPSKSFIHADDFTSFKQLVVHLDNLVKNLSEYNEYLHWVSWVQRLDKIEERLKLENRDSPVQEFCKLCQIIANYKEAKERNLNYPLRIVPSIQEAWSKQETLKNCTFPDYNRNSLQNRMKFWRFI